MTTRRSGSKYVKVIPKNKRDRRMAADLERILDWQIEAFIKDSVLNLLRGTKKRTTRPSGKT